MIAASFVDIPDTDKTAFIATMRKLIAITQLSLDGVMQSPGGRDEDPRGGFTQGGWFMAYGDDVLARTINETIAGEFDLLLGRRTYDIWTGYWPHHGDNPIGAAFNRATKYVATRRRDPLTWPKSQRLGDDIVHDLRQLKTSPGPDLHVWGSGELLQTLIAADVIDEYRHWIAPLVLGQGKRLFEPGLPPRNLTLVEMHRTTTGLLLNTYRPADRR